MSINVEDLVATPSQVEIVEIKDIVVNDSQIRKVDPKNLDYIAVVEDLRKGNDIHDPVDVRQATDKDTGIAYYELIDGGHRVAACKEVGVTSIKAFVYPEGTTRAQCLGIQFRKNKLRVKQTKTQEAKQFERMMATGDLTAEDMSLLTGYSVKDVKEILSFGEEKLTPEVIKLVDTGKISVNNARVLSKAGKSMQNEEILDSAMTLNSSELKSQIDTTKKALNLGDDPTPKVKEKKEFEAKYKALDKAVITKEIETGAFAKIMYEDPALQEAFTNGVKWSVSLDEQTVTEAREAFELAEADRERIKAEKDLIKQKEKLEAMERKAKEAYGIEEETATVEG